MTSTILTSTVLSLAKMPRKRSSDVGDGQLAGGDLVEQRLELVVVVPVEQRHGDVVLGQLLGASHAGEPAAEDDHRGRFGSTFWFGSAATGWSLSIFTWPAPWSSW